MTVYFEPKDRYNINYYAPMLLAQVGAKLLGDEFTAMRNRAANAKRIQAAEQYWGNRALDDTIADPGVKALVTGVYRNPNFWRMGSDAQKQAIDAFKLDNYVRTGNPMDTRYIGNIPQAIEGGQGSTAQPSNTTSIVGQGVTPGSSRIAAQNAWGTALGVPTAQMTEMNAVLAPKYDTKTINLGGNTVVARSNDFQPGIIKSAVYKNTTSPDTIAQVEGNREAEKIKAAATVQSAAIHAQATKEAQILAAQKQEAANDRFQKTQMLSTKQGLLKAAADRKKALGIQLGKMDADDSSYGALKAEFDSLDTQMKGYQDDLNIYAACLGGNYTKALNIALKAYPDYNAAIITARNDAKKQGKVFSNADAIEVGLRSGILYQ